MTTYLLADINIKHLSDLLGYDFSTLPKLSKMA